MENRYWNGFLWFINETHLGYVLKLITNTQIHSYPNPQNSREFYGGKQLGYMSHPKPFQAISGDIKELEQCKIPLYTLK